VNNGAVCTGFYNGAEFEDDTLIAGVGLAGDGSCEGEALVAMGAFFAPAVADAPTLGCVEMSEGYDLECDAAT
jgi:hypothetical protein